MDLNTALDVVSMMSRNTETRGIDRATFMAGGQPVYVACDESGYAVRCAGSVSSWATATEAADQVVATLRASGKRADAVRTVIAALDPRGWNSPRVNGAAE